MNETLNLFDTPTIKPLSVSELTKLIKGLIENKFENVWVQGEISNFSTPASGHWYLTLKDKESQINGVMFKGQNRKLKFAPQDGLEILCHGRLSLYEPRGSYQILVDYMEPLGRGALQLAFEQLKERLSKEGLFDPKYKKEIPFLPRKIAVITSPTGAAVRDFLKVISRRFSGLQISIIPVPVQGDEAAPAIVAAIEFANEISKFDLILLTRGGGSLEDLWPFNEESVARAIFASKLPIVSAIGHEIDFTIADFVADLRAPTPSAAAEMIIKSKLELMRRIEDQRHRLFQSILKFITLNIQKISNFKHRLVDPRKRLSDLKIRLDDFSTRLKNSYLTTLKHKKERLDRLQPAITNAVKICFMELKRTFERLVVKLDSLSPLSVLARGFSIVTSRKNGVVLSSVDKVKIGETVDVKMSDGSLSCEVIDKGSK